MPDKATELAEELLTQIGAHPDAKIVIKQDIDCDVGFRFKFYAIRYDGFNRQIIIEVE